jgi:hypothetical protein
LENVLPTARMCSVRFNLVKPTREGCSADYCQSRIAGKRGTHMQKKEGFNDWINCKFCRYSVKSPSFDIVGNFILYYFIF